MKVTLGGQEILNTLAPTPVMDTFGSIHTPSILMTALPNINIDGMGSMLVDLGQQILLGTSGVVIVVCGILIAVGLKREGWKRVVAIIEGLGVGLVGPTVVMLVAALFTGLAKSII